MFNEAEDDGEVTNTMSGKHTLFSTRPGHSYVYIPGENAGDNAGDSFTGDARGGRGNNRGPGGNALSGNAGASNGGNLVSEGGTVTNTGASEFSLCVRYYAL